MSPRFLFPADSGGLIRTTQILRGMKGRKFEIVLASPGSAELAETFHDELEAVSDHWSYWEASPPGRWHSLTRMRHIMSDLPIPVATDRTTAGREHVAGELARSPDVAVFDFPHSAVLAPDRLPAPSLMFTHNVEAEIFSRHADAAGNPFLRLLWRNQTRKMKDFEGKTLARFDTVVAVSARDKRIFEDRYRIDNVEIISTGVDLDFFAYRKPEKDGCVLFLGSMDWLANIDAINWYADEIWPLVIARRPDTRMRIVGRNPPASLVSRVKSRGLNWEFTGFVDDVRDHVTDVSAFVIPLRVGGGTRIKVYEAIAMGMPVVSTSIGVEGLPLKPDQHYFCANEPEAFASATLKLLTDDDARNRISSAAFAFIRDNFSSARVASEFEAICLGTAGSGRLEGKNRNA